MRTMNTGLLIRVIVFCLLLSACESASQARRSETVITSGESTTEEIEIIKIDNCDGKADISQVAQRSQSVDVSVSAEVAAKLGLSIEVISAEVQASVGSSYGKGAQTSKSIQLVSPPGTYMSFEIVWKGAEQIGFVPNFRNSGVQIEFRRFAPIDVVVKSQRDLGCDVLAGTPTSSIQTDTPIPPTVSPTNKPTNTSAPPSPTKLPPTATFVPTPVIPTDTPFVPAVTPWPNPTPVPDTTPGSILEVGDEWRQNGVGLRLTHFMLKPESSDENIGVGFEFWNYTDSDIIVSYRKEDFLAATNTGSSLTVLGFHDSDFFIRWCNEKTVVVPAGTRYSIVEDECAIGHNLLWITADLGNPNLYEVVIRAVQFARITDSRWRIRLNR